MDLIITEAYSHPKDTPGVLHTCELVEDHGGHVCPVQLVCDQGVLEQRIQKQDRVEAGKTSSVEELRSLMQQYEFFTPIPGRESFSINNTDVQPDEAARRIAAHYSLSLI
ncbi:MAG: hypothetical protein GEU75_04265 [Dehalococcoidia bacterium]|nr:hypothetical protein [Dehalococcoidia bacterium]